MPMQSTVHTNKTPFHGPKAPLDRLSPDSRRACEHELGAVGTPVVSTRASLSPPSPTPTRGSDGIERLAVLLKDSIMSSMEARLSKLEDDMRNQIGTLMTHVQMVDHRVEIARIEQKELGEEVQSKMQGIQDVLTVHRGQFLNAVATVEKSVASAVAAELSRGCVSPAPVAAPVGSSVVTPCSRNTPGSLSAQEFTPQRSTPLNHAIDLSTKLASALSESGFHVHREAFNYIISWDTDVLNLRRGYLMWAFKAAGLHKDAIRPYPHGPGLLDCMILFKAGIREHHIPTLVSFMTRVVEIAGTAQSTLMDSARRETDEAATARMFRQMVSQYPGMVSVREELGRWVANEGFDPALLLMPHATINPAL
ncbi:hypothetical protein Pmar_PMAR003398 [Perkinsus marinus ATCC 50983]|uniref:Uncharacterized protein n=1 Tax=Perkinsus marinus (strain ATCC 50983 / TXsc) TaxID=423536 RepID=C5KH78_PERM5|nr:hypothetical protein Pmar_PMAR003398 [Perkinsus marinus ATCC 50983]EER15940.1 hypothetical protein Pmar_PMAR003398 [Perkinsus marinus ATCC 50983]|eukprot:XP_002784144.1 hypothetical protein Pmar_PMAR003398 [Perkinsus marinus ATCC 50983]